MKIYRALVTNNKSPNNDGRVQIRIFEIHGTENSKNHISDKFLPYAEVIQPIDFIGYHSTNAFDNSKKSKSKIDGNGEKEKSDQSGQSDQSESKKSGLGRNIIIENGTWVFCILDNDDVNRPIILGCMVSHGEINENSEPLKEVKETISGHYFEISDKSENERIFIEHRTGTSVEFQNNGTLGVFTSKNFETEILENSIIHVDKNKNEFVGENSSEKINETKSIECKNLNEKINETKSIECKNLKIKTDSETHESQTFKLEGSQAEFKTSSETHESQTFSVNGTQVTIKGDGSIEIQGAMVNITAQGAISITAPSVSIGGGSVSLG